MEHYIVDPNHGSCGETILERSNNVTTTSTTTATLLNLDLPSYLPDGVWYIDLKTTIVNPSTNLSAIDFLGIVVTKSGGAIQNFVGTSALQAGTNPVASATITITNTTTRLTFTANPNAGNSGATLLWKCRAVASVYT